jgi:2-C-methyl-D-erythritol 4-phosphate cytidylyltransferase/2-C-methyl-D-erythritol 4-phosphate cytidylyltransferase/2-C-methyl-D-erythritol 2,4-cyclodiphosphate synthase
MAIPEIAAVITAAGSSRRMGGAKKEYRVLDGVFADDNEQTGISLDNNDGESDSGASGGKLPDGKTPLTVLGAVVCAFEACKRISMIVISVPLDAETGEAAARKAIPKKFLIPNTESHADPHDAGNAHKKIFFVPGGSNRRISVHHALSFLEAFNPRYVLIHDGARPWIDTALIDTVIDAVLEHKAVVPVLPLTETPKELGEGGGACFVARHLKRQNIVAAQTPQAFLFPEIVRAHEKAAEQELHDNVEWTDDAEIWGAFAGPVAAIPGSLFNRKITFPEDL